MVDPSLFVVVSVLSTVEDEPLSSSLELLAVVEPEEELLLPVVLEEAVPLLLVPLAAAKSWEMAFASGSDESDCDSKRTFMTSDVMVVEAVAVTPVAVVVAAVASVVSVVSVVLWSSSSVLVVF